MRNLVWPSESRRLSRVILATLWIVTVLSVPFKLGAQEVPISRDNQSRIQGDYTVAVYPQPFGFFFQGDTLYLRVGGVGSDGQAAPLLAQGDGRFKVAPDHPNVFQFQIVDDQVRFTFWSGSNSFPGTRVGEESEAGTPPPPPVQMGAPEGERTRDDLLAELAEAEVAFTGDPSDTDSRLHYGQVLFESGEFWEALEVVAPLAAEDQPSTEALSLAAKLFYLTGEYDRSAGLYRQVIEVTEGDPRRQVIAKVGLLFAYYQQTEFGMAAEIQFPQGVILPNSDIVKVFEKAPYQLEWSNTDRIATVPFLVTDPLPMFKIEVQGRPINVLFDTGADMLVLDTEIAEELGVEWVTRAVGQFGGGLQGEFGMGRIEQMSLGDVTIREVPVMILPTKRFSAGIADGEYTIGGIVGTQTMRQFLGTLDYENGQLILRERTPANGQGLREDLGDRLVAEVPFVLDASHMMMTRGRLNEKSGLTFYVDSGLAHDVAGLGLPIQTLEYLGIAEPETTIDEDSVGGGGGVWASGTFDLGSVGMGTLMQNDITGTYGGTPPSSYWRHGFIQDGVISHRFLRQYSSWTIDFERMVFLFTR